MAKVPYSPVPTVEPSQQAQPEIHIQTSEAAFGGNVATAISQFGKAVEGAGDEMFRRALAIQELENRTEADEAAVDYATRAGIMHEEFKNRLGKDAKANLPQHMEELRALRESIGAGLSNPMSRRLYNSETRNQLARQTFSAAGHAGQQQKNYIVGTNEAKLNLLKQNAFAEPDNDFGFTKGIKEGEEQIEIQGAVMGWGEDQILAKKQQFTSEMYAEKIKGVAQKAPAKAAELLEKAKDKMIEKDFQGTEKVVQTQVRMTGSRMIADVITRHLQADPESKTKTLQQMHEEGRRKAEEMAPNDPLLGDYVVQRINAQFGNARMAKRDADIADKNAVDAGIITPMANGKLPTTLEELSANPAAKAAYERMDPTQQKAVLKSLSQNSRAPVVQMTPDRLRRYQELKGMADDDPMKFLEQNIIDEDLPSDTKKQLINLQIAKKGKAEQDPRVLYAIQVMQPTLVAAGITARDDQAGYYAFRGSMQDALDAFQRDNKRLPKADEIQQIGSRLLQQSSSKEFILPWSKDSMFRLPVPEAVANRIKGSPIWQERGYTPTEEDIRRIYVREQYEKLYSKPAPMKPTGPQAPRQ